MKEGHHQSMIKTLLFGTEKFLADYIMWHFFFTLNLKCHKNNVIVIRKRTDCPRASFMSSLSYRIVRKSYHRNVLFFSD